jgi:hypothetical protein
VKEVEMKRGAGREAEQGSIEVKAVKQHLRIQPAPMYSSSSDQ